MSTSGPATASAMGDNANDPSQSKADTRDSESFGTFCCRAVSQRTENRSSEIPAISAAITMTVSDIGRARANIGNEKSPSASIASTSGRLGRTRPAITAPTTVPTARAEVMTAQEPAPLSAATDCKGPRTPIAALAPIFESVPATTTATTHLRAVKAFQPSRKSLNGCETPWRATTNLGRTRATKAPAISAAMPAVPMAAPGPTTATISPPTAVPRMRPMLTESLRRALTDCRASGWATWGTKPVKAG